MQKILDLNTVEIRPIATTAWAVLYIVYRMWGIFMLYVENTKIEIWPVAATVWVVAAD